jgi:hypothetical protein
MTNIRFIKKSRHPRRNRGDNSLGEKGQEENKSVLKYDNENSFDDNKRNIYLDFYKQYQLNFK